MVSMTSSTQKINIKLIIFYNHRNMCIILSTTNNINIDRTKRKPPGHYRLFDNSIRDKTMLN